MKNLMFRVLCFSLAALIGCVAISQEVEQLTPEAVRELYQTQSIPFGGVNEGRPALLIMSAGCAQCVELATLYKEELLSLATEQGFNTRFVEMPGAVAEPDENTSDAQALLQVARVVANSASMILECSDANTGEQALSMIADLGRAARLLAGTVPDPSRLLTTDWANWVYLSDYDDEGQLQSTAAAVLQMVAGARNIDLSTCDQDSVWDLLGARHAAILNSGIAYVPGLYLLPDESFPRFMVWDYEELFELISQ